MAERPVEFVGLAHVHDLHLAQVLFEPVRLHLPDAGEGVGERRPVWIQGGDLLRSPAFQVRGQRHVHLLRVRESEMRHVANEVFLADRLGKAGVVELFLAHARHREAAIVMAGIDQALLGEREDLAAHRAVERARIAVLEVGAAAAADEKRIARERHRLVVEHVGEARVRVASGGPRLEVAGAERQLLLRLQIEVRPFGTTLRCHGDAAAELLLEQPCAGDMVGVHVRLERELQAQAELLDQRRIAPRLLEHRVDEQRIARALIRQQIGISRGLRIVELAEYHRRLTLLWYALLSSNARGTSYGT